MINVTCDDCGKEIVSPADEKAYFDNDRCEACFILLCQYMEETDTRLREDMSEQVNGSIMDGGICDRCPAGTPRQTVTQVEADGMSMSFCDKHLVDFAARVSKRFSLA